MCFYLTSLVCFSFLSFPKSEDVNVSLNVDIDVCYILRDFYKSAHTNTQREIRQKTLLLSDASFHSCSMYLPTFRTKILKPVVSICCFLNYHLFFSLLHFFTTLLKTFLSWPQILFIFINLKATCNSIVVLTSYDDLLLLFLLS